MDGKAVAKGIEKIHNEYVSAIQYNNEKTKEHHCIIETVQK